MEKNKLLLKKFIRIKFGNHVFFMPRVPSNIHFEGNSLTIDMADMKSYVIVDGIRCYYCLIYDAENDIIQTWIKDFKLDGILAPQLYSFSFPLSAKDFPFSKRDSRKVVPNRDYSEVTSAFLAEHEDLHRWIVEFLQRHPAMFEKSDQINWINLSDLLHLPDFDAKETLHNELKLFPKEISELFRSEVLEK